MVNPLTAALGFYLHSLGLTFFEQFFAVFMSYSLLVLFKEYYNTPPSWLIVKLIGAAYAAYIVHQWVVIPIAVGLAYTNIYPLLVVLILMLVAPILSFLIALLLKAIPGSERIL
jgi:hypothetical protein